MCRKCCCRITLGFACIIQHSAKPYKAYGLYFIDFGNYHYVIKLWDYKISEPFSMVMFDHHPDMQPYLFDEMLSCGSCVKTMFDTNKFLRKVFIIGVADRLIRAVPDEYRDRVKFYGESSLDHAEAWRKFSAEHVDEPVYISVDKDVINTDSAVTNWGRALCRLYHLRVCFQ